MAFYYNAKFWRGLRSCNQYNIDLCRSTVKFAALEGSTVSQAISIWQLLSVLRAFVILYATSWTKVLRKRFRSTLHKVLFVNLPFPTPIQHHEASCHKTWNTNTIWTPYEQHQNLRFQGSATSRGSNPSGWCRRCKAAKAQNSPFVQRPDTLWQPELSRKRGRHHGSSWDLAMSEMVWWNVTWHDRWKTLLCGIILPGVFCTLQQVNCGFNQQHKYLRSCMSSSHQ